jgi:hypothetical protein
MTDTGGLKAGLHRVAGMDARIRRASAYDSKQSAFLTISWATFGERSGRCVGP